MDVQRHDWWCYPLQCRNGHPWAPGRVNVSWMPCDCGPAQAVRSSDYDHMRGELPRGWLRVSLEQTEVQAAMNHSVGE